MGEVDRIYEIYKFRHDPVTLDLLIGALTVQARAVIWKKMRQHRPDVENECLLRAVRALQKFREGSRLSTWFYRIVENRCNTVLRKEARRREVSLEEATEIQVQPQSQVDVMQALEALSRADLELLDLKRSGRTDEYIAMILGCKDSTLRSRWRRLKLKLRKSLVK